MLPVLRILPVGGVLLAITLLALALNPLDGSRAHLRPNVAPVRGAMIELGEHPEWRQFLILAAFQRADELSRLRELPDSPVRTEAAPVTAPVEAAKPVEPATPAKAAEPAEPKLAGLPTDRSGTDPDADDVTGSIMQPPPTTIPVEIGETSAFELPVATPEENPPVIRTPQRLKSRNESRPKTARHARRVSTPAKPDAIASFDLLQLIFGPQSAKQLPAAGAKNR